MTRREEYTHVGPIVTFSPLCALGCGREIRADEYYSKTRGGWRRREVREAGYSRAEYVCPACIARGEGRVREEPPSALPPAGSEAGEEE